MHAVCVFVVMGIYEKNVFFFFTIFLSQAIHLVKRSFFNLQINPAAILSLPTPLCLTKQSHTQTLLSCQGLCLIRMLSSWSIIISSLLTASCLRLLFCLSQPVYDFSANNFIITKNLVDETQNKYIFWHIFKYMPERSNTSLHSVNYIVWLNKVINIGHAYSKLLKRNHGCLLKHHCLLIAKSMCSNRF